MSTPRLEIDMDIVRTNLQRVQSYAAMHRLSVCAHFKSFKSLRIARMLAAAGVREFAAAKVGEAELLAEVPADSIHLAYPAVGAERSRRIATLCRNSRLSVSVDSLAHVRELAAATDGLADGTLGILLSIDSGFGRASVREPAVAAELLRLVLGVPQFSFRGIECYLGSSRSPQPVPEFTRAESLIPEIVAALQPLSEVATVSLAGAGTLFEAHRIPLVNRICIGSFLMHDLRIASRFGSLASCSVKVRVTVVSRPSPQRVIIDAGSKALARHGVDFGRGTIFGAVEEYPDARLVQVNEEHGWVELPSPDAAPGIGDELTIIPVNQSLVVGSFDSAVLVEGGRREMSPIEGRGKFI